MCQSDPIIDEIHEFRAQHAAQFGYDVKAIVTDFMRQQNEAKARGQNFVKTPEKLCKTGFCYTSANEEIPSVVPPIEVHPIALGDVSAVEPS